MIKVIIKDETKIFYSDLKKGDIFSWPVAEPPSRRAIGLKLYRGFVWIRAVDCAENDFCVDYGVAWELPELRPDMRVKFEGNMQITLED